MDIGNQWVRQLKKGQKVFSEKDKSREFYYIQKGRIKIQKLINGHAVELAELGEKEIFGELAMLDGKPRSATALVQEDCELQVVTEEEFHKSTKYVPEWYLGLIRISSERLRMLNERLHYGHRLQNIANVAHLLVLILKKQKRDARETKDEVSQLDMKFAKGEVLQILGINQAILHTSLSFLEQRQFIQTSGNRYLIGDPDRLLNYSKFLNQHTEGADWVLMDDDIRLMLSDLKILLDKSFAKSEVVTFSVINLQTELKKNTCVPEGREEWFLNTLQKIRIVKFYQSDGSQAPTLEKLDPNGQISVDSFYLTQVLQEETFKRMGR